MKSTVNKDYRKLEKEIYALEQKLNTERGRLSEMKKALLEFKFESVEEAEEAVKLLTKNIKDQSAYIEKEIEKIKEKIT